MSHQTRGIWGEGVRSNGKKGFKNQPKKCHLLFGWFLAAECDHNLDAKLSQSRVLCRISVMRLFYYVFVNKILLPFSGQDDFGLGGAATSSTTGNSGPRVACGVVVRASHHNHDHNHS